MNILLYILLWNAFICNPIEAHYKTIIQLYIIYSDYYLLDQTLSQLLWYSHTLLLNISNCICSLCIFSLDVQHKTSLTKHALITSASNHAIVDHWRDVQTWAAFPLPSKAIIIGRLYSAMLADQVLGVDHAWISHANSFFIPVIWKIDNIRFF